MSCRFVENLLNETRERVCESEKDLSLRKKTIPCLVYIDYINDMKAL